ncbi:MAG: hypothetical protein IKW28_10500 [Lachnospiraceae bacterium]|nr:hypothetical protein [Lachnospiraceae bacterium]
MDQRTSEIQWLMSYLGLKELDTIENRASNTCDKIKEILLLTGGWCSVGCLFFLLFWWVYPFIWEVKGVYWLFSKYDYKRVA